MSLFENNKYHYRETIFVLFRREQRPPLEAIQAMLTEIGPRFEVENLFKDEQGFFESLTILAPYDFAAMDITYVEGEDVTNQVAELNEDLRNSTLAGMELKKLALLAECDARFDIYHFEQLTQDEEECLDPGSLLIVQEKLAIMTGGVGIDPQSGSLM